MWLAGTWNDNPKFLERCKERGEDMVTRDVSFAWGNKRNPHYVRLGDRCIFTIPIKGDYLEESRYYLPIEFGKTDEVAGDQQAWEIDGEEIDEDAALGDQPDYVNWLD
jgi:hypothetical protein